MQGLADHTVDRILCDPDVVAAVKRLKEEYGSVSLEFIFKFGLDGSKGRDSFTSGWNSQMLSPSLGPIFFCSVPKRFWSGLKLFGHEYKIKNPYYIRSHLFIII